MNSIVNNSLSSTVTALWRRPDAPGHDAAQLVGTDTGWQLRGTAVFLHTGGPARLDYMVQLDRQWLTRSGSVGGFVAGRSVAHTIDRSADGWMHNGRPVPGLGHLFDLDFGFTPATNLQQLRRLALGIGQAIDAPVAWLDTDLDRLVELPQRYQRQSADCYAYEAPTVPYRATLQIDPGGFVAEYPGLWTRVRAGDRAGPQG